MSGDALRFAVRRQAERPRVTFSFPHPLEDYRGEVGDISGELTIDGTLDAATLRGFIEARTESVTLGDPDIDSNARSAMFLNVRRFPVSRFTITGIETDGVSAVLGEGPVRVRMLGDFLMRGRTVAIAVPTTLTAAPRVGGVRGIALDAGWELDILRAFGIPGPGPGEAGERVILRATLELEKLKVRSDPSPGGAG